MTIFTRAALTIFLATASTANAQDCRAGATVAFTSASVLTMRDSTLLKAQTVIVTDGRITALGNPAIPAGACRIDASGKVLLPGLTDMHAHMTEGDLPLFLSNGITLVREMNGSPAHVALRNRIQTGTLPGPRLVLTSPLLTGKKLQDRHSLISTAAEAHAAGREAKSAGYNYLKIYDDLTKEAYDAFVAAGKTHGLPLDGHIPKAAGIEHVLASGQSIQHIDKIAYALLATATDSAQAVTAAQRLFTGKQVWVTPTLASLRILDIAGSKEYADRFARPEMSFVDSGTIGWWKSLVGSGTRSAPPSRYYRLYQGLLPALKSAGTRFLLGTDASNPMMVAGFSAHEEMEVLVRDGGFTRWDVLRMATTNAAEFLGEAGGGQVRVGARADLILVSANPLADLTTLQRPLGVMAAGRWMDRRALDALVGARK